MTTSLLVLAFTITLIIAVLQSGWTKETILSNSVLFLVAGFVVGSILNLANIQPDNESVSIAVQLALVSVLYVDSMHLDLHRLREVWRLPSRALLLGMPLTLFLVSLLAHFLLHLSWAKSFLVGAVLSPTDPVLVSDLISSKLIPARVRVLLNVESGLNDGLALPVIIILLRIINSQNAEPLQLVGELIGGIAVGIAIPWIILHLERLRPFKVADNYRAINILAIGALVLSVAANIRVNSFLAAFFAGLTVVAVDENARDEFAHLGAILTELFKLAALFIFGLVLNPVIFLMSGLSRYLFAILVLIFARPVSIFVALIGSPMSLLEKTTVAWYGPKGFASILYSLIVWRADLSHARLFAILALTLVISIIAHSSTGLIFRNWFRKEAAQESSPP